MSKPIKVRYSGVAAFANQWILSRVQTVSVDVDMSEEEIRELTNPEVVEYASQTPAVSITIDTNEYGSMRNLRCIAGGTATGNASTVNVNSFDGASTDLCIQVEEDNVLKRTMHINDAFLSSISWNFDVGGIATESFTFEADNKLWYLNDYRETYAIDAVPTGEWGATHGGSGWCYINTSGLEAAPATMTTKYKIVKIYADGILQNTGTMYMVASGVYGTTTYTHLVVWATGGDWIETGSRYRVIVAKTGSTSEGIAHVPEVANNELGSPIGGLTRGMIDINLVSTTGGAFPSAGTTNLLRIQTCSVDADLSREVLNELGHFRAYDRSLTLPIPVNITLSALSSDLQEWFKFQGDDTPAENEAGIGSFLKTAKLQIKMFDKKDTETSRTLMKTLTISGLQVVSESFGVDVGGNATQDFSLKASNFALVGSGTPIELT